MSAPVLGRLLNTVESYGPRLETGDRKLPENPAPVGEPVPRANPSSEVTDPICRLPLPSFAHSTRGCSPWRPAAVMSTNRRENHSFPRIFKGLQERTGHHMKCGALPAIKPYLLAIRFHGVRPLTRKENSSQGSCRRLRVQLRCRTCKPQRGTISTFWFGNFNPIPFRSMVQDWTL